MPSLDTIADRHVVIDRRQGHYLCFPDLCLTDDGRLLCVYNEFDRHVGTRRRLMLRESADLGRTWSAARILCSTESHCPRISRVANGEPGGLL
ncbi:MAG: exo-alpha-sialidase, partial [Proteobacteria bacterium]|nr:exo-alpha-sialidase [Pseudomonadota bacterium]